MDHKVQGIYGILSSLELEFFHHSTFMKIKLFAAA
jgi:hypothetical protein